MKALMVLSAILLASSVAFGHYGKMDGLADNLFQEMMARYGGDVDMLQEPDYEPKVVSCVTVYSLKWAPAKFKLLTEVGTCQF